MRLVPPPLQSMTQTAQNAAECYGLSRAELDAFSAESHRKTHAAYEAGIYKEEVIPLEEVDSGSGPLWLGTLLSDFGLALLFGGLVVIAAAWPEGVEYLIGVRFFRVAWVVALLGTLLYVVAVPDMMYTGYLVVADTYRPLEVYTSVAIAYFVILYPITQWAKRLERRSDQ